MNFKKYYENIEYLHEGTEANRAYYMPYFDNTPKEAMDRFSSDRVVLLSGMWDFQYYESIEDFDESLIDSEATFNRINVPSCWQMHGYDKHQYVNIKYPIPFDPPYVPDENPCGFYKTVFTIDQKMSELKQYLNFEGVDSCFFLWVNGTFAGYSQVSHSTSEFDITNLCNNGENQLAVLVLKWCDGTYFEDQDKFRMSGIFRDVYIISRPEKHIRDFTITTKLSNKNQMAKIAIQLESKYNDIEVSYKLCMPNGEEVAYGKTSQDNIELCVKNPQLWSAESPYLYKITLDSGNERIDTNIGIREVSILNKVVLINGNPIKFKGVNRHDSSPVNGFSVTVDEMIADLVLMKENNINAVRTSHYPNSPVFYDLCDYYGLYVIDEADIEAHGVIALFEDSNYFDNPKKKFWTGNDHFDILADDDTYADVILDRVQRCIIRDKNRSCVVIWSLGNESGYGICFEKAASWIKAYDDTRLTHYESSIYHGIIREMNITQIDLMSRMYDSSEWCSEYCEDSDSIKPLILCEYICAMGNGPGDIEDYWEIINNNDNFCGGFVWEWCDHAIYMGKTVDGKSKYYYGGDFGDFPHDGSYIVDGLIHPNRKVHPGLLEYKNVMRPIRAKILDLSKKQFILHNYLDFINVCKDVLIAWSITRDGEVLDSGTVNAPDIPPHKESEIIFDYTIPEYGDCYLKLDYLLKKSTSYANAGHLLGFDQFKILSKKRKHQVLKPIGDINVSETEQYIFVYGEEFNYTFSKKKGLFKNLIYKNHSLFEKEMSYNIWRAPTENDRFIKVEWEGAGYNRTTVKVYNTSVAIENGDAVIRAKISISAISLQRILNIDTCFRIQPDGTANMDFSVKKSKEFPCLPRFGVRLFLPKDMDMVKYSGYGPYESYIDKHHASWYDSFEYKIPNHCDEYIFPQECGSHWGCDKLSINSKQESLFINGDNFSFNASHFTQEELDEKTHDFELTPSESTILCIDYMQSGIGSNSCGPDLLEKYRLDGDFNFKFFMKPNITNSRDGFKE